MFNFSVALIAKNEVVNIPELYDNLKQYIDMGLEVVVIDTGSTDDTIELAKKCNFSVYKIDPAKTILLETITEYELSFIYNHVIHPNDLEAFKKIDIKNYFNFAKARNLIQNIPCKNDIFLFIDASDRIRTIEINRLNDLIKSGVERFEYYLYAGDQNLIISRFYNRKIDNWVNRVHEVLTSKTSRDKIYKCHDHELSVEHFYKSKSRNYIAGLLLDYINTMDDTRYIYYLGREFYYMHMNDTAMSILEKYLDKPNKDVWRPEKSSAAILIGECYERLNNFEKANEYYLKAIDIYSAWREPYIRIARLCQRTDDFHKGAAFAMAALSIDKSGSGFAEHLRSYTVVPFEILYWAYYWTPNMELSKKYWEVCYNVEPDYHKYKHDKKYFIKEDNTEDINNEVEVSQSNNLEKNNISIDDNKVEVVIEEDKNKEVIVEDKKMIESIIQDNIISNISNEVNIIQSTSNLSNVVTNDKTDILITSSTGITNIIDKKDKMIKIDIIEEDSNISSTEQNTKDNNIIGETLLVDKDNKDLTKDQSFILNIQPWFKK